MTEYTLAHNMENPRSVPEVVIVLLVAAVQFINIVDFMMVMPLGPDFTRALGVDSALTGLIGASYTFSAALGALLSFKYLDRFDRRKALLIALLGLSLSTAAAAMTSSIEGLITTRLAAGLFGGPATSVAMAILIDHIPVERRGRAVGIVMSAFSLAAIAGVPFGLQVAIWWGWQAPFILIGFCGLTVLLATSILLPPQIKHLEQTTNTLDYRQILNNGNMLKALIITAFGMFSSFLLIPYISPFIQFNMQFPRQDIASLYMLGGLVSFLLLHLTGRFIDRYNAVPTAWLAMFFAVTTILGGFVFDTVWPAWLLFAGLMGANAIRNVTVQTLTSQVPEAAQRAGFMATQSAVRHMASGVAAILATIILSQDSSQNLVNMPVVGAIAVIAALPIPILINALQNRLNQTSVNGEQSP